MKKFIFNPIFTLALLGLGFTACEDDKLDEKAKTVDVTITVTLPDAYEKVPLANLPKDSIKVTIGDQTLYTDTAGSVSATVEEGAYQLSATLRKVVEGLHNDGRNGLFVFDFLGTKAIAFSNETTTATINLLVSGEPEFSGYGEIAYVGDDTIHLKYKGDTINLAPLFTAQLKEGDIRTLTYSYEIVSQPQKRETGGNGTGLWTPVYDGYAAYDIAEESKLVAIDSLIAAFDLTAVTGKKREVSPAIVRAKLFADGDFIAQKDVPVLQDSISTQLVGIAPAEGIAFNVGERVTPGTNIFTVATPYAGNGLGVSLAGQFSGYFTDTITKPVNLVAKMDPNFNFMEWDGVSPIPYIHHVHIAATNDNGSPIPVSDDELANNTGHPISAATTGSGQTLKVNTDNFIVNKPTNGVQAGETGQFYIYPHNSTPDDFITLHLTVKAVTVTGIAPLTDDKSQQAGTARRFRVGQSAVTQARYFANLTVSEGPARVYNPDENYNPIFDENNGIPLLVVKDSWNTYNDKPTIEFVTGNASQKAATLSLDGGATYVAAGYVRLTTDARTAPAETPITFKVCPKDKFDPQGNPDPAWTVNVTTKIYAQ